MSGFFKSQNEKSVDTADYGIKEKAITGCVKTGTTYSYFDQSGLVVKQSSVKDAQIPVVEGVKIKSGKLYKQIRTSNQTKFNEYWKHVQKVRNMGYIRKM